MRISGAVLVFAMALSVLACSGLGTPAPTPGEQCQAWGYAPDDPECLKVFRRYAP